LEERLKQAQRERADTKALEQARQDLDKANRRTSEQSKQLTALSTEKATLEDRLKQAQRTPSDAKALEGARHDLDKANRKLEEQSRQLSAMATEKATLEDQLKKQAKPTKSDEANAKRIKELERDREELRKELEVAKESSSRKTKTSTPRVEELQGQVATMHTKLLAYEANAVPYSPEELALLKTSPVPLAAADTEGAKKSSKELPASAKPLLAEAQKAFASGQLDKAEEKYLELLHQADENVYVLANLAAIQLERDHFDDAEKHIKQAVALAPEDAYSLSVLGRLKFRQHQYDESLEALTKAAQIEPQNAVIQNYLGVTLSQKGMRAPAETALRKAVQLQPGYAEAHHNLAVAYATQQPPLLELAKWHYQKALAAGAAKSPELEKLLQPKKAE
jgi:Flp pilus assembly protein TadD